MYTYNILRVHRQFSPTWVKDVAPRPSYFWPVYLKSSRQLENPTFAFVTTVGTLPNHGC